MLCAMVIYFNREKYVVDGGVAREEVELAGGTREKIDEEIEDEAGPCLTPQLVGDLQVWGSSVVLCNTPCIYSR